MKLVIKGLLPGLNQYIAAERTNRHKAAKMKRDAEKRIALLAKAQLKKAPGPVEINYLWVEPNKKRDKDNIAFGKKFIQDALVKAGILPGDGWRHIVGFTDSFTVDASNPRVEVEIKEVCAEGGQ